MKEIQTQLIYILRNLIKKALFLLIQVAMKFISQNHGNDQKDKQNPLDKFSLPLSYAISKVKSQPHKSSLKSRKVASKFSPIIISSNGKNTLMPEHISPKQQPNNSEQKQQFDNSQQIKGVQNEVEEVSDNLNKKSQQKNYKIDLSLDVMQRMTVVLAVGKDNRIIKSDLELRLSSKEVIKDQHNNIQNYQLKKIQINASEASKSAENSYKLQENVKDLAQCNSEVRSVESQEKQEKIVPIEISNEQKLQKQTLQSSKEPVLPQKHAFSIQRTQKPSIPSTNLLSQQLSHPAYEQVSLSSKKNQTESKQKLTSKRKIADKVPEPTHYTCHCNTRGCRDHYCGCIRRGLQCSTSCLCSDCTNLNDQKQSKMVVKMKNEERMELNDEIDKNLEFGIEFEPVCFLGFGGDEMRENVETNQHRQCLDEEKEQVGLSIQEGRDVLDRAGQSI